MINLQQYESNVFDDTIIYKYNLDMSRKYTVGELVNDIGSLNNEIPYCICILGHDCTLENGCSLEYDQSSKLISTASLADYNAKCKNHTVDAAWANKTIHRLTHNTSYTTMIYNIRMSV